MNSFQVTEIGKISINDSGMFIQVEEKYIPALQALNGFSHLSVIWWFSSFDTAEARAVLETPKPYKNAPDIMGIFATRSPIRPNPLALSTVEVLHIDYPTGLIQITYIDADNNTPVLDIKPYTPSNDRVEAPAVPAWCAHWPASFETSGDFNWEDEFAF